MKFYGREKELRLLAKMEQQSQTNAQLTIIMGRRRIGKTSLILKALHDKPFAYLFIGKEPEAFLCQRLQQELSESLGLSVIGEITKFRDLFHLIMKESQNRHFSVVLDEVQNLYKVNPLAFGQMQELWDRHKNESKLNLICCGSIHTLMKHIFEDHSEPLYGRATAKIRVLPFSTSLIKEILRDFNPNYEPDDLLALYMLTGGVAKYMELFMDNQCCTKDEILDYAFMEDSYFLTEGRDLITNEFSSEYETYFSVLRAIAEGKTRVAEIDNALGSPSAVYLSNLEKNYELIKRLRPVMSKPTSKVTRYQINDHFLRFWFRFIYPYQSLIERKQLGLLRKHAGEAYAQFSGLTLERYFQDKLMESDQFTVIGNWWDRSGENEIDIVALNEFEHTGLIAEVKRNPAKIYMPGLEKKGANLPHDQFAPYQLSYRAFTLADM